LPISFWGKGESNCSDRDDEVGEGGISQKSLSNTRIIIINNGKKREEDAAGTDKERKEKKLGPDQVRSQHFYEDYQVAEQCNPHCGIKE